MQAHHADRMQQQPVDEGDDASSSQNDPLSFGVRYESEQQVPSDQQAGLATQLQVSQGTSPNKANVSQEPSPLVWQPPPATLAASSPVAEPIVPEKQDVRTSREIIVVHSQPETPDVVQPLAAQAEPKRRKKDDAPGASNTALLELAAKRKEGPGRRVHFDVDDDADGALPDPPIVIDSHSQSVSENVAAAETAAPPTTFFETAPRRRKPEVVIIDDDKGKEEADEPAVRSPRPKERALQERVKRSRPQGMTSVRYYPKWLTRV